MVITGITVISDSQEAFNAQWNLDDIPACDIGMVFLKRFADVQPDLFRVLAQNSFYTERGDARLDESPQWAAFIDHFTNCENCNEI